jgi:hypothetical protein
MARPREVKFFYDEATGTVVVRDRSGIRVLQEISGSRKTGDGRRRGRRRGRPPKTGQAAAPTGKPRGRPRKAKPEEKKSE